MCDDLQHLLLIYWFVSQIYLLTNFTDLYGSEQAPFAYRKYFWYDFYSAL